MRWMLVWHATFHAGSFWIYTIGIYLLQYLAFLPIDIFDFPDGAGIGLFTLIYFIVVCFIWWTYRGKIKEDHSSKSDDSGAVDRREMQFLVNVVRVFSHKRGFGDRARGVAIAGSVAVDMLAISALLKFYLLPHGDLPARSQLTGDVIADVTIFAVVILIVVAAMVLVSHALSQLFRNSFALVLAFRLAEPLVVFYLVAGVTRTVLYLAAPALAERYADLGFVIDLAFASLVVVSLVLSNGISWTEILSIYARRSDDSKSNNPTIEFSDLLPSGRFPYGTVAMILSAFIGVLAVLWIAYSTEPGRDTHNHLIEATGYFAWLSLISTTVFLYVPSLSFDEKETRETASFIDFASCEPRSQWYLLSGATLALIVLNGFNILAFGRSLEVEAIFLWSVYLTLTWLLFDFRRLRFYFAVKAGNTNRQVNDADFAELISTVGVSSSLIALVAQELVSKLIA